MELSSFGGQGGGGGNLRERKKVRGTDEARELRKWAERMGTAAQSINYGLQGGGSPESPRYQYLPVAVRLAPARRQTEGWGIRGRSKKDAERLPGGEMRVPGTTL